MKKLATAIALCCALTCSQVHAKTFVGVLWPMFGPAPAIGLVELVAELKLMPDVEVTTYLHQSWPSLVADIDRQDPGTHTVVIGYSLGANSSVIGAWMNWRGVSTAPASRQTSVPTLCGTGWLLADSSHTVG